MNRVLNRVQKHLGELALIRVDTVSSTTYNLVVEVGNEIKPISIGITEAQVHNTLNAIDRILTIKAKQEDLADQALSAMHPEI